MQTTPPPENKPPPAGSCCASADIWANFPQRIFKALSDANRVTILARLARCCRPQSVGEVASCCPVDLSVVSRHLGVLRDAGIVTATRRGRSVLYEVRHRELVSTLRRLADAIEACCVSVDEPDPRATEEL